MQKHEKCLICSSNRLKELSSYYESHELVKCKSCGFVFMENIPTEKELNKHYSKYSYTSKGYLSPITIKSYNILLNELEKYRKNNKLLDVGCGRGWFLIEAKKRGWEVYGTEYSETAKMICEENGIRMKLGKLTQETFASSDFDVITSFEVIEHINNPVEDIGYIYEFLRKGGLFYCTTPNFNSLLRYYLKEKYNVIEYPEHLSYYTSKTLKKLATSKGFTTIKVLSTGISITRLKTSNKTTPRKVQSRELTEDEKLRQRINNKWYLGYLKKWMNYFLTLFGFGMTLKGYFLKSNN